MRIAVLDLSYWPPEYMTGLPKFGEVLADWVALGLPEADLSVIDIVEGDPIPGIQSFDGYVLSGSDLGVYDEVSWMQPLRAFVKNASAARQPLFGVCFGHQLMADVLGGKAEKVGPPEVGVRHFEIGGDTHPAHVWHQDQVTQVPPGAEVIASAPYCSVAGLSYGFPAMSVQFHPEYPAQYMAHFLRKSRGEVLEEDHTDSVLTQLEASDVRTDLFAGQMGDFFRRALATVA